MKKPFFDKSQKTAGQAKSEKKAKAPAKTKSPAKAKAPVLRLPSGWYLMVQKEVTVEDLQSVMTQNLLETEIWKDAGVLEVILKEKCSLDLETCPLDLEDDYSNEFLADHKILSLFYASFPQEGYQEARTALRHILKVYGGLVCGDTDDFMPRIEA